MICFCIYHSLFSNWIMTFYTCCIVAFNTIPKPTHTSFECSLGCPAQPPGSAWRHSPLRGATVCGQSHLIPILLKAGADPNAVSDGNRTPLMGACFLRKGVEVEKSALCVRALLEDTRTDPTIRNSFGESALDLAKVRGYTDSIGLVEKALSDWNKKE